MSANHKQNAGGGPQQRFTSSSLYQPIPQQPRSDGFHVPPQPYVQQQQPNQPGNQAQTLRNIQPTGQPNQASTPPTDLKVQAVSQQSMNHLFVGQQQQVRAPQQYYRPSGPPNQATRMPNQHRQQQQPQQMYPATSPYMYHPMYVASSMQFYNGQRPPFTMPTPAQIVYTNQVQSQYSFQNTNNPQVPYITYSPIRQGPPGPTATVQQNPAQAVPQLQIAQPPNQQQPMQPPPQQQPQPQTQQPRTHTRRKNAIAIIDPATGRDRLDEVYEQQSNPQSSHPPSGESSARQTPQPNSLQNTTNNKEVQATFAKQVAQVINSDRSMQPEVVVAQQQQEEALGGEAYHMGAPGPNRLDHVVQGSNLTAHAKEFVLNPANAPPPTQAVQTAKETTPIVSANIDAVEVTLPNKQQKDRESPAKGRKNHHQQQQKEVVLREHKDSINKDTQLNVSPPADNKESNLGYNATSTSSINTSSNKNDNNNKKDVVGAVVGAASGVVVPSTVPQANLAKESGGQKSTDDKKLNQKLKDNSKTTEIVTKVPQNDANDSVLPTSQTAQDNSNNAKSKNSYQRGKEAQKQPPPSQAAVPPTSSPPINNNQKNANTPTPQPPKSNNKSNKKTDLNQKGANKEGTDMDAFNDNNPRLADTINANIPNEINANDVMPVANTPITPTPPAPIAEKKEQPIKPQTKVNVCDIVRETVPKPVNLPKVASFNNKDTQDETDRAATVLNDKLVQAKNEANKQPENSGDSKPNLPYRDDQWAPGNPDGKKVYEKDFLMALRNTPASIKKPTNIPDQIVADERGRLSDGRYSMGGGPGGRTDFTNPPFVNYGGKSSSQRGPPPKRNSQSGKLGGGGGKGSKSQVIKVSISVREDVKLNEVENAWKPARLNRNGAQNDEELKTEELYKKVRGVLNKLTPQKFDTLLDQVRALQIDTAERLQGVIDLVFEKAVDEPNFSVAYALMCREVALMQVPTANSTPDKQEYVNFRKLLLTRCQWEFEKQSSDESTRNEKLKEIEECTDPERKKEMEFELNDSDRKLRMKSVGNIRFIGELFKQNMLTINIMVRCLHNLLDNKDEESLECLCKLLTTIGKELDHKKVEINNVFQVMKEIVDKKHGKVSSRIRFMLQDVLDLRKGKWVPRRGDANPKTIDQIQEEAKNEQMNIQAMNSNQQGGGGGGRNDRKDERSSSQMGGQGGGGGGGGGPGNDRKRRTVASDDGWQTPSRNNRSTPFTVQSEKLKNSVPLQDAPLGSSHMFASWNKGASIGAKEAASAAPNATNMFAALDLIDADKRPAGGGGSGSNSRTGSREPYSSKGASLERAGTPQHHRSMEREAPRQPAPVRVPVEPPKVVQAKQPEREYNLSEEELQRRVKNNLDEYLTDSSTVEEYTMDMQEFVPPKYFPRMVADGYFHVLEKSSKLRLKTGELFAKLIKQGTLSIDDYCSGLEDLFSQAKELVIDIPKFWTYLGEILVHLICTNALPLSRLHKSCDLLIKEKLGSELLGPLFQLVIDERGSTFLTHTWNISGLSLEDFMDNSEVDNFIKQNKFDFLSGGSAESGLTYEQIHMKLNEFFSLQTTFDAIVSWITANVGERVKENQFIRTLATSIFEKSIIRQKLVVDSLQHHYKLLQKYVDTNSTYELQCLYALQALFHKMEHPQGVLLAVCNRLYDDSIISQDSFVAWETSNDPAEQEGKGVALKQLTCFFTQLKENEDDESGESSDEA